MRSHVKATSAPSIHPESVTLPLGVFAAMLVCAAAFLGIGAPAAGAATAGLSYGYQSDIGAGDSGVADEGITNPIAVSNDDGNVFLLRQFDSNGNSGFDLIDPSGTSLAQPLFTVLSRGLAASADGSIVFATGVNGMGVRKYVSDGGSPPSYVEDSAWTPAAPLSQELKGIAVDPVTGDLLVAESVSGIIYRLDPTSGALLSSFDGSTAPTGRSKNARSIAVAPNRDVYVVSQVQAGDNMSRVRHMGSDGSWKGDLDLRLIAGDVVVPNGIAVDPQSGDVAVDMPSSDSSAEALIRIYSATNDLEQTIRVPDALASDNRGLAFSPDGSKLYVALSNGSAHVFVRDTQPGLDTPDASQITPTAVHLTGGVATGGEPTTARLEYCLASDPCTRFLGSEGSSPWKRLPDHNGLVDPEEDEIEDDLTGLVPNTKYLVRTFAVNEGNQIENVSATTPVTTAVQAPLVTTGPATDVVDTSSRLSGSVDNTFGAQTTYHFEYGLTTDYGSELPSGTEAVAGNLRLPRTFTKTASGLQPGTTYHYRLVATNSGGTTVGEDRTFTTLTADQVSPRRGYEQVTVNKNGLSIQANWGFQAAPDGSAIEFAATQPPPDSDSAAVTSRYVARRGSIDWLAQQPLDPPFLPARGIVNNVTLGVSSDFQHTMAVSQVALTPDATEGFANIYVRDLDSGAYSLVGTASEAGAFVEMTGVQRQKTFIAGAADFSWVVLISRYPLLPNAPQVAMYKWSKDSGLALVSLLPGDAIPTGDTKGQSTQRTSNRFVADDGDTFTFSLEGGEDGVYRRSGGETVAVSVSEASGGPTGTQPGIADGISRDGRFVFFHSTSQLTDTDQDGGTSMYRYDAATEGLEYLGPQDGTSDGMFDVLGIGEDGKTVYFNSEQRLVVWREGQPGVNVIYPGPVRGKSYGYASPNGRFFEFVGDGDVHLYDAASGAEECLSCDAGVNTGSGLLPSPDRNISNRLAQVVTDDGHAYFNATAPLVGADRNASLDVYEYYQGRLTLISPGARDFTATLVDISPDGSDVFFTTAEGLVARDTDQSYDVYDARIGGGFAAQNQAPPPPPCVGEACQGPASAPPPPSTPGSAISGGSTSKQAGNVRCRRGTHKVRRNGKARCVRKQKKHSGKKRDAKHNRGESR